ncbi:MAG: cupin domain-containing protein [Oscillospiraceae bacterium]|nr:cupin domain-containing protein [Oscillospiraceae bacterium]
MIKAKEELVITTEQNEKGIDKLFLSNLADFEGKNSKLRTFALAKLNPGEEVEFHIHEGECESYYIISGSGLYSDNGKEVEVYPGTVTFTPSGEGHGIKNTGKEILEFIALIILD